MLRLLAPFRVSGCLVISLSVEDLPDAGDLCSTAIACSVAALGSAAAECYIAVNGVLSAVLFSAQAKRAEPVTALPSAPVLASSA